MLKPGNVNQIEGSIWHTNLGSPLIGPEYENVENYRRWWRRLKTLTGTNSFELSCLRNEEIIQVASQTLEEAND